MRVAEMAVVARWNSVVRVVEMVWGDCGLPVGKVWGLMGMAVSWLVEMTVDGEWG